MATLTIPEEFAQRSDLMAVPRAAFEEFVAWQKEVKSRKRFVPTPGEKRALARARKNRARGNYITLHELRRILDRRD